MSGLMDPESLDLTKILSEENTQYHQWEKRSKQTLEPIFKSAAEKLEKIVNDKSTICALLTKQWPKEGRRLREYLPDTYKQTKHNPKPDVTPQDEMEEFLLTISEIFADGHDVFGTLYKRYKSSTGINRNDFSKQLRETFESNGAVSITEQLEGWKKYGIDMAHAKQESDERTKLQTFYKVMVRIQALYGTKSDVANKARLSQKWYKNGIEMDPTIQENFNKMMRWMFPDNAVLADEMAQWFAKCLIIDRQDPNAKMPEPPTRKGHPATENY